MLEKLRELSRKGWTNPSRFVSSTSGHSEGGRRKRKGDKIQGATTYLGKKDETEAPPQEVLSKAASSSSSSGIPAPQTAPPRAKPPSSFESFQDPPDEQAGKENVDKIESDNGPPPDIEFDWPEVDNDDFLKFCEKRNLEPYAPEDPEDEVPVREAFAPDYDADDEEKSPPIDPDHDPILDRNDNDEDDHGPPSCAPEPPSSALEAMDGSSFHLGIARKKSWNQSRTRTATKWKIMRKKETLDKKIEFMKWIMKFQAQTLAAGRDISKEV